MPVQSLRQSSFYMDLLCVKLNPALTLSALLWKKKWRKIEFLLFPRLFAIGSSQEQLKFCYKIFAHVNAFLLPVSIVTHLFPSIVILSFCRLM